MYGLLKEIEEQAHKIFRVACHDHHNEFIRLWNSLGDYPILEYQGTDYNARVEKDHTGITIKFTLQGTNSDTMQQMVGFLDDLEIFEQECRRLECKMIDAQVAQLDEQRDKLLKKKSRL